MTTQLNRLRGFQEIAFLDTNAMHYVRLYIGRAKKDDLYPFGQDMKTTEAAIQQEDGQLRSAYNKGLDVVTFCKTEHLQIHYSAVSALELAVGRAKGEALLRAASEGVPERKWTGFASDDQRVSDYLDHHVLAAIHHEMPQLVSRLQHVGIYATSDDDRLVPELALELTGLVYMATADCLIYSHALVVRAQYVVTYDEHFKNTVNRIGDNPQYEQVRRKIRRSLPNLRLPQAPGKKRIRESRERAIRGGMNQ